MGITAILFTFLLILFSLVTINVGKAFRAKNFKKGFIISAIFTVAVVAILFLFISFITSM